MHDRNKNEHDSTKTPHRTRHMGLIVFEQTDDLVKKLRILRERTAFMHKISEQPKPHREYKRAAISSVPHELQELFFS